MIPFGVDGRGVHRLLDPQGADGTLARSFSLMPADRVRGHTDRREPAAQSVVMNSDGSEAKLLFDYPDYYSVGNACGRRLASIVFNVDNELLDHQRDHRL